MNNGDNQVLHKPVLLQEVVDFLAIKPGNNYIDATVGSGGHAAEIVHRGGRVLGIDRDPEALIRAGKVLRAACPTPHHKYGEGLPYQLVKSNFVFLEKVTKESGFFPADGVVFDLGFSTEQVENPVRGLSFLKDSPLDMRMDPNDPLRAEDIINNLNERRLYELFSQLAEEPRARAIARAVVGARDVRPITNTKQLKNIVVGVYGREKVGRLHVATRVFQALRMAVNQELENLELALPQAVEVLRLGGRLVVIGFHSGEDRVVKRFIKRQEEKKLLKTIVKKPIRPSVEEIKKNPRSRSARLRVAEKV